jgi:hypothetical protein
LQGVLQQEPGDERRQCEEALVHEGTERDADQCQTRCIGFQRALHVPFLIQFLKALMDPMGIGRVEPNALLGFLRDPLIDRRGGVRQTPR